MGLKSQDAHSLLSKELFPQALHLDGEYNEIETSQIIRAHCISSEDTRISRL